MPYTRSTRRPAYRRATQEQVRAWADENPDNARALDTLVASEEAGTLNEFTSDILRKLRTFGSLSERQVGAVLRGAERDADWAARREAEAAALKNAPAVAEGRRNILGEIVSAKWRTGRYGTQPKVVIRQDDGNKVWGTLPVNLVPDDDDVRSLIGQRITITGTVRRAEDDIHFGFFSRPSDGFLVTAPADTEVLAPAYQPGDQNDLTDGRV